MGWWIFFLSFNVIAIVLRLIEAGAPPFSLVNLAGCVLLGYAIAENRK